MQSPAEFMESFLTDLRELHRAWLDHTEEFDVRYYSPDAIHRVHREFLVAGPPETIQDVSMEDDQARVVTTGFEFSGKQYRRRYLLEPHEESWRIIDTELVCSICNGTGLHRSGKKACNLCNGRGWIGSRLNS